MALLIDTDIIIYSLKSQLKVRQSFEKFLNLPKAISVITYGELMYGAGKSTNPEKNTAVVRRIGEIYPVLEITVPIMETFGQIKSLLEKQGRKKDDMDLIISATALVYNYKLITNNLKHFEDIPGLEVETWT